MSVATLASHVSTRKPPQSRPIPGRGQVQNHAGGYVFQVDCWTRLDRFLILGSEGGTYYCGERSLTRENAKVVVECAREDGYRTVERIVEISTCNRAPKNDQAIFALAIIAGELAGTDTATYALNSLPKVCRTATMLFQFVAAAKEMRGWGRALRDGIARWYLSKPARDLGFQVTKYQQRDGWSHRDLLRLSHPTTESVEHNAIFRWVCGGVESLNHQLRRNRDGEFKQYENYSTRQLPDVILAFEEAKITTSAAKMARLIREEGLVREHVPTQYLNDPVVWEALLEKMPAHAMIRNLGKMTSLGLLKPLSAASRTVCEALTNPETLKKARVHPMALLMAQKVYQQGHGDKGKLSWTPDSRVIDALNDGFYSAFAAVEPTGLRWLLALDVSGSMGSHYIAGSTLTAREASAALALVTANCESEHHIVGFTNTGRRRSMHAGYSCGLTPVDITPRQRLTDAVRTVSNIPFGGTDCALPMIYAREQGIEVDVFVVYTDNETWAGNEHPVQALKAYRDKTGINAKLIVNGLAATAFSIADPNDRGMLDVVGFDSAVPAIMADFAQE